MAQEISISISLGVTKGNLRDSIALSGRFDLAASAPVKASGIAIIGTGSHEAIPLGDLGTPGFVLLRNLDDTNYVEVGKDSTGSFVPFLKLKAGEPAIFRLSSAAPYAKANTGNVRLQYEIYDA